MNWIAEIKKNADRAMEKLYIDHQDEAIAWARSQFNVSREDAEEAFQTSIVIMYDNIMTGKLTELSSSIKTYILAIMKNKVWQEQRQSQKTTSIDGNEIIGAHVSDDYEEMDPSLFAKAKEALMALGEPCKSLLELFYYKSYRIDQITTELGYKNTDTAKNQKYKCLKRLQSRFFE